MLPVSQIDLSTNIVFENYPSNTFYIDPISNQVYGKIDGLQAVTQTVEIILSVERFYWQIYSSNFGVELQELIGNSYGLITSEIKRRVDDSFSTDNRILGTDDWLFTIENKDTVICSFTVLTVYGEFEQEMVVKK